jgi:hypothetical protein
MIASVLGFNSFCKRESSEDAFREIDETVALEIDVQKIKNSTGISFDIIKTRDIGYEPLNKFCWVNVEKKIKKDELKNLAQEIIKAIIEKKPQTYHSFTIHFFCSVKIEESKKYPRPYAKVTYLPEGSWAKVGRVPINDYSDYELLCTIKNNMLK